MPQFPAASAHLAGGAPARRTGGLLRSLAADRYLYLLAAPAVVVVVLFAYLPMIGVVMAFQDYSPVRGFFRSPWVGLENFADFFSAPSAARVIRNSVLLSLYQLLWSFPAPIRRRRFPGLSPGLSISGAARARTPPSGPSRPRS